MHKSYMRNLFANDTKSSNKVGKAKLIGIESICKSLKLIELEIRGIKKEMYKSFWNKETFHLVMYIESIYAIMCTPLYVLKAMDGWWDGC